MKPLKSFPGFQLRGVSAVDTYNQPIRAQLKTTCSTKFTQIVKNSFCTKGRAVTLLLEYNIKLLGGSSQEAHLGAGYNTPNLTSTQRFRQRRDTWTSQHRMNLQEFSGG